MLVPNADRLDYGEQLNPPVDYELDSAIATTYSLDLNALLAVPVALCFGDTLDGDLKGEKLALLEAISQLKNKVKVFYQKGNISLPPTFNRLFTLLEPCLQPLVPKGGAFSSFHPKLWLLRFIESEPAKKKPKVLYRLIVLSRNLTFDRSWDVAVTLDGELGPSTEKSREEAKSNSQWLDFVQELLSSVPSFEPGSIMKKELPKIIWQAPNNFNEVKLLVGGGKYGQPVEFDKKNNDELLVVSPFLKSAGGAVKALDWLADLAPDGEKYLFSRAEELNAVGEAALADWKCYAMNEQLVSSEERHELVDTADGDEQKKQNLHAKLIVQQQGSKAYWHLGSANATAAALGNELGDKPRNTETMVSLVGLNKKVGPKVLREQWLSDQGTGLFTTHEFENQDEVEGNPLDQKLREAVHALISADWNMNCTPEKIDGKYTLVLKVKPVTSHEVNVTVEQLAFSGTRKLAEKMEWNNVELSDISAFIPVSVIVGKGKQSIEKRLLIEVGLKFENGDKREHQIMKSMINTPDKLINYLNLLLQVKPDKNQWLGFEGKGRRGNELLTGTPILEKMLIASSRHPKLLQRISDSLQRLEAAKVEIPEEFVELWKHFEKDVS